MRSLIVVLSILSLVCSKSLTAADRDAISNKVNEIEDKIFGDLETKYGANSGINDLKTKLTNTINGAITKLEDKIAEQNAEMAAVAAQPKGFLTDIASKTETETQSKIDQLAGIFNELKDAASEKKEEKQKEFQDFLTNLKDSLPSSEAKAQPKGLLTDIFNKQAEKDAERKETLNSIIDSFSKVKDSIAAKKTEKEQEIKEAFDTILTKIEQLKEKKASADQVAVQPQTNGVITDLANTIAAKKEEERQEKLVALDQIITIADQLNTVKKQKEAEKDQKMQELRDQVEPYLNQTINNLKTKFEEAKKEKQEQFSQVWADIKTILSGFKTKLDQKIVEKDEARKAKWTDLKNKIHDLSTNITASIHPAASAAPAETVAAEPKATFLDDITGASSWQTVTWILLAVCVLLALALVVSVFYQMSQRNKYDRLDGYDHTEFPPVPRSGNTNPSYSAGPTAPAAYPTKEIQQF